MAAAKAKSNKPPKVKRRRFTAKQIQERRIAVWEMMCCDWDAHKMAEEQGVSEKTIQRDMKWWRDRLGLSTDQLKDAKHAAIDVGMTAAMLKQIGHDAYVESVGCTNHSYKQRYLETAGRMFVNRHKILADAGFLPKVGHEKEEEHTVKVSFEARFGADAPEAVFDNDQSRRRVIEAVQAALGVGIDLSDEHVKDKEVPTSAVTVVTKPVDQPVEPSNDQPAE